MSQFASWVVVASSQGLDGAVTTDGVTELIRGARLDNEMAFGHTASIRAEVANLEVFIRPRVGLVRERIAYENGQVVHEKFFAHTTSPELNLGVSLSRTPSVDKSQLVVLFLSMLKNDTIECVTDPFRVLVVCFDQESLRHCVETLLRSDLGADLYSYFLIKMGYGTRTERRNHDCGFIKMNFSTKFGGPTHLEPLLNNQS